MKKNINILLLSTLVLLFSCIKQVEKQMQGNSVAEIDATPLNSSNAIAGYPVLAKIPAFARPILTADSTLRRLNGTVRVRINLVGPQVNNALTVGYKIMSTSPLTTFSFPATASGQTPSAAAATLNVTNAVSGTHYTPLSGLCTIPANSSFGYIDIAMINGAPSPGQARFIGIQLDSSGTLLPNPNYNKLGLVIDQR
jgi:hypothetical protein